MKCFKLLCLITSVLLIGACTSHTVLSPYTEQKLEKYSALQAVSGTRFDAAFQRDDLGNFSTIYVAGLDFSDAEIDERRLEFNERGWEFTEREQEKYQDYILKRSVDIFDDDASLVFSDSAELTASIKVLKFKPNAPKDTAKHRTVRSKYFTRGVGLMSVSIELRDSATGEIVAIFEDEEEVGENSHSLERNDRVNNQRHMRLELSRWLNKLENTFAKSKGA